APEQLRKTIPCKRALRPIEQLERFRVFRVNAARASQLTHIRGVGNNPKGPRQKGSVAGFVMIFGEPNVEGCQRQHLSYGNCKTCSQAGVDLPFEVVENIDRGRSISA